MNPAPVENIAFMRALFEIIEALGKRTPFEAASPFYATIEPGGDQPWPLVMRAWNENDGQRSILVANYYWSHGWLRPYPEFVVTAAGRLIWQRSVLAFTQVPEGDSSRNYELEIWAETLRQAYVPAAAQQKAQGRADRLLFLEEDVLGSIERQRQPEHARGTRQEWMGWQQGCLEAFASFLGNREAVRNAVIQATYLVLREAPEHFYLVCAFDGNWCTLAETDLAQCVRWSRHAGGQQRWMSVRVETVADDYKLFVRDFVTRATGVYIGSVNDTRTLPQIARELGYFIQQFIEKEVDWHLDQILDRMRRKKALLANLARRGDDEDGGDAVGA